MSILDEVPAALQPLIALPNWVVWHSQSLNKVPLCVRGGAAESDNPSTWSTYEEARSRCERDPTLGLGFVLTPASGLACVDLDTYKVTDPAIQAWHEEIIQWLDSFTERSPRGGSHVWVWANVSHGRKWKAKEIEIYNSGRYMTVTGHRTRGTVIENRQSHIDELLAQFPPSDTSNGTNVVDVPPCEADTAIAQKVELSHPQLWNCDPNEVSKRSEVDYQLCKEIVCISRNREQSFRVFMLSPRANTLRLYRTDQNRNKCVNRPQYVWGTIEKAFAKTDWFAEELRRNAGNQGWKVEHVGLPLPNAFRKGIKLVRAADVPDIEQKWIIENIIADETLTGVLGDPGVGKTTFVLGVLAWLSKDHNVVMLTNEDNATDIRRTFKRLGGNLDNLLLEDANSDEMPWLMDNCAALEDVAKEHKPRIIAIDSLYSHAPTKADLNKHGDVAPMLIQIRKLANIYCPIILIHHDNKSNTTNSLKKSGASNGIVGTIRHNVRVHEHPDNSNVRVVAVFKTNIGKKDVLSLQFSIDPFEWDRERSELSDKDLLRANNIEGHGQEESPSKQIDKARSFLIEELKNGPRLASDLEERAQYLHGISKDTLGRAKRALLVESVKESNVGPWMWRYAAAQVASNISWQRPIA
jgi:AAA domain